MNLNPNLNPSKSGFNSSSLLMAPHLKHAFTLHVDLAPPQYLGHVASGERRFVPIIGGTFVGSKLSGTILPGGGDWNAVRSDGVVHVLAKYTIQADDGTLINVHNEGYGRATQKTMSEVFGNDPEVGSMANGGKDWYTKTWPRFEVRDGPHAWLNNTCFVGDLQPPTRPNHVIIEVYEII